MVLSEFLGKLRERGFEVTEPQIRAAFKSNRLSKPSYDASHRFNFTTDDLDRAVKHFSKRPSRRSELAST